MRSVGAIDAHAQGFVHLNVNLQVALIKIQPDEEKKAAVTMRRSESTSQTAGSKHTKADACT